MLTDLAVFRAGGRRDPGGVRSGALLGVRRVDHPPSARHPGLQHLPNPGGHPMSPQEATAYVECPTCEAVIPVTFTFRLDPQPYIVNGEATFLAHAEPDLTDVWGHAWTHSAQ
jgi:hypothetical protein